MTDRERALAYLRVFAGVGPLWRQYVPVDADIVTADSVRIGTVEIGPGENGSWWLKDLSAGTISRYQAVAS